MQLASLSWLLLLAELLLGASQFAFVGEGINRELPSTAAILGSRGNERLKGVRKSSSTLGLIAHASRKFNYILTAAFLCC